MTTERDRFRAVMDLVDAALDLPETERDAMLDRECTDDAMRAEAKRLLDADARAGNFLDEPAVHRIRAGAIIGPFRLTSLLGRGGMGEVWIGERIADFEQKVAVKLLPIGDDSATARFVRERQILARLAHPRIAKLLDGGVTIEGRPWLAMELVEGRDLMAHASELDIDARLALFVEICDAVQFAHQNLVVHRDLKPSNVIVTRAGEPKLLDFGIAKLLEADDRDLTKTNERPMTLDYAAPEQVRGEVVTTASDVWALGVILHELLTGVRPYGGDAFNRVDLEQAILAAAPSRPSSSATSRSEKRQLRGDLDAIVLKAMRRAPAERYASVEALAADVRHHLDHAPVIARGGARTYLIRTAMRRHRVAFVVSSLVIATLVVGLVSTLWQARRAREEARRAEETQEFLISMLRAFDPREARDKAITQRDILDRGEARVNELGARPEVQARLLQVFAETWFGMGEYERAKIPAERALEIERRTLGARSIEVANTLIVLGDIDFEKGDFMQSARKFDEALSIAREVEGPNGLVVASALNELAGSKRRLTAYDEAEKLRRESLDIYRKKLGEDDIKTLGVTNDLAVLVGDEGRFAESAVLQQSTCEHMARLLGASHVDTLTCWTNLSRDLIELGRFAEADAKLRDVYDRQSSALGANWPEISQTLKWRAVALDGLGRSREAIPIFEDALARKTQELGPDHPEVATILVCESTVLDHLVRYDDAETAARHALSIARARLGEDHAITGRAHLALGTTLADEGKKTEALPELRRAVIVLEKALGKGHIDTQRAKTALARVE